MNEDEVKKEIAVYKSNLEQLKSKMIDYLAKMPSEVRLALSGEVQRQLDFYKDKPPCFEGLITLLAKIGLQACLLEGIRFQID